MNDLDEKIARGDAGVKIAEERAARRQKLAGLIEEEKRAAEVERQINAMLAELQTRRHLRHPAAGSGQSQNCQGRRR